MTQICVVCGHEMERFCLACATAQATARAEKAEAELERIRRQCCAVVSLDVPAGAAPAEWWRDRAVCLDGDLRIQREVVASLQRSYQATEDRASKALAELARLREGLERLPRETWCEQSRMRQVVDAADLAALLEVPHE